MCGLPYGVFVTSKLKSDEGSIVQIVVAKISIDAKEEYSRRVKPLAKALCNWLHSDIVLQRGYLMVGDVPSGCLMMQNKR